MNKGLEVALKLLRAIQPKPSLHMHRLVAMPLSHYSEKARWALDLSPLEYYEESHVPAFHLSVTLMELANMQRLQNWQHDELFDQSMSKRHSSGKQTKTKALTAVPQLVVPPSCFPTSTDQVSFFPPPLPGKRSVPDDTDPALASAVVSHGSCGIIRYLVARYPEQMGYLYPVHDAALYAAVLELEALLDRQLGPAVTQWSYGQLILSGKQYVPQDSATREGSESKDINTDSVDLCIRGICQNKSPPLAERILFQLAAKPLLFPLMCKGNNITATTREEAETQLVNLYKYLDEHYFKPVASASPAGSCSPAPSQAPTAGETTMASPAVQTSPFLFQTEKPTAADIALAALSSPLLLPSQAKNFFCSLEELEAVAHAGTILGKNKHPEAPTAPSPDTNALHSAVGCERVLAMAKYLPAQFRSARLVLHMYDKFRLPAGQTEVQFKTR